MQPGDVIQQKYRLEARLGEGGLGVVWAAWQSGLERRVAIKVLRRDVFGDHAERFAVEARTLGRLDHPNCVGVFDFGHTDAGQPFIVMEHIPGQSLATLRGQRVPWRRTVAIIGQIVDALIYTHEQRIIHRDLKPENVMLVPSPRGDAVKVLDFGLAKFAGTQTDITRTGEIFGTPQYMSPEQLRGLGVSPSSDLYAVGIILFELLEGHPPFGGGSLLQIGMAHLTNPSPPITNPDVPAELAGIVTRLLAKEPSGRFADARQLAAALAKVGHGAAARGEEARAPASTPVIATLGVVVIVLLGFIAWLLLREPETVVVERVVVPPAVAAAVAQPPQAPVDAGQTVVDAAGEAPVAPPSGCGKRPSFARSGDIATRHPVLTVLPPNYDPDRRYPLVVMLHEKAQSPQNLLTDTQFRPLAERENFIVAIPEASYIEAWGSPQDFENLVTAVEDLQAMLCIDPARIYALGHVSGGDVAERLACDYPVFAAIATSSHRAKRRGPAWCTKPIPNLYLAPLKDGYNPVDGGRSCSDADKLSLAEHEEKWREINGCEGERKTRFKQGTSECFEWQCETPFVSCHLDGGHNWPGAGVRALDKVQALLKGRRDCDGQPADFPYAETVWNFFKEIGADVKPKQEAR